MESEDFFKDPSEDIKEIVDEAKGHKDILNKINEFLEKINKCKAMSKVVIKRRSSEEKEEEAE